MSVVTWTFFLAIRDINFVDSAGSTNEIDKNSHFDS